MRTSKKHSWRMLRWSGFRLCSKRGAARSVELAGEEVASIKPLGLLTAKPIIYATNVSEEDLADGNAFCTEVIELAAKEGAETVRISAQVEAELIELGDDERTDYLEGLG